MDHSEDNQNPSLDDETLALAQQIFELVRQGNIDALINLADYYSNQGESQKSINLLDSLKEKDKQSALARMVRLKLRIKLSDNISDEIKKEFDDLTDEMSKAEENFSTNFEDEDILWLSENDFEKK